MSTKLSSTYASATTQPAHDTRKATAEKRGTRLRFLRKITGMVTDPFGRLCGVGRTTISSWEQGINPLTERGAEKVINGARTEGIHCTTLWLLHGIGEPPKIVDQDKLSKLNYHTHTPTAHTSLQEPTVHYIGSDLAKEIELFKHSHTKHIVHCIEDDSMYPSYRRGDWVGGIILSQEALDLAHDMDCIARISNDPTVVRRVQIETLGAFKISLYGTNAHTSIKYPPYRYLVSSQIAALAPIVRIWRNNLQEVSPKKVTSE